jgi:hypothetical protein
MKVPKKFSRLVIAFVVLAAAALVSIWGYSAGQLRCLANQQAYFSPEDGMRALASSWYSDVAKVEIVSARKERFNDLRFVVAHVWAAKRQDGKGFRERDYDNPGCFFLRTERGWVFVPEGKFPEIIALGKLLFGLSA